jgi:hypothetical protein
LTNNGTISGGTYGILSAGTIGSLNNAGGVIASSGTGIANAGTIGTLTNSGTIAGTNYAIKSTGGQFGAISNSGTIAGNISIAGQNVSISGGTGSTFGTLTGGTITVGNGNLVFAGGNTHLGDDISVNGGTGSVTNEGVLQVAESHLITGSFIQTTAGVLDIQAAGTGTGEYGSLTTTGTASFAGGLAFDLINGFTLAAGDAFDIFNYAAHTGDFSSFSLNGVACSAAGADAWSCGGWTFTEVFYGDPSLWLDVSATAAPEPATLGLFGSALAALSLLRRRRRARPRA